MYGRLNQLKVCISYPATLELMDKLSKLHTIPVQKWIQEGTIFKLWGDNVDKQTKVRDYRSDHQGQFIHMFSVIAGCSRTPAPTLQFTGQLLSLSEFADEDFLPKPSDIAAVKSNMVVLVSRILTQYFTSLAPFSKVALKHIPHRYSFQMSQKSEVAVLDILMKNEAKHKDMVEIMEALQGYLGENYPDDRCVLSGGDLMTCERELGAQKHVMCGNTRKERLGLLEPVVEDWHCLVTFITVSILAVNNLTLHICKIEHAEPNLTLRSIRPWSEQYLSCKNTTNYYK